MYGEGAIAERTARDWYAKFKNGNFYFKDAPRSGRPVEFDEERLNQLLHENSRQTTKMSGTGRENGMLLHYYRKASTLDGKGSQLWRIGCACFK